MGGFCSKRATVDNSPSNEGADGHVSYESIGYQSQGLHSKKVSQLTPPSMEIKMEKNVREPLRDGNRANHPDGMVVDEVDAVQPASRLSRTSSQRSRLAKIKPVAAAKSVTKVSEVGSLINRAGTVGLGKAVEVLDNLGSSMTSLHISGGFVTGTNVKGNKISILAFEVANTIVKGANLMQSLSKENIKRLKEEVLISEGVRRLVSKDMDELLRITAFDKSEELKIFSGEVVRFGNRCKDPQWHNLNRYFDKLSSELIPQRHLREEADSVMRRFTTLVQYTAELYHELHALDRFDQDYKRKLHEEENSTPTQRGESLAILRAELKSQKKHVRSLKKKSLWSKNLEEIIEKLVDIVHFLYLEIHDAFGLPETFEKPTTSLHRLGPAGLALHYAGIISQIDSLLSRSSSVPPNTRDTLYQGLPPSIKSALRSKLLSFEVNEELTVLQIKGEMEKTLTWLVPIATNTTKAHHGFGWVGEWANTGSEVNRKLSGPNEIIKIETLHHADKEKTEVYILELIIWLHQLISLSKSVTSGGIKSPIKSPVRSPNKKTLSTSVDKRNTLASVLTVEDHEMLRDVNFKKLTPGISKSQEFDTTRTPLTKHHRLSKSSSHFPTGGVKREAFTTRKQSIPVIDFEIDKPKALDVIDRVDTVRSQ